MEPGDQKKEFSCPAIREESNRRKRGSPSFLTDLMGHISSTQRDYPQKGDKAKNNTGDILFVVPDCFKINLNRITQSKNILSETFRIN